MLERWWGLFLLLLLKGEAARRGAEWGCGGVGCDCFILGVTFMRLFGVREEAFGRGRTCSCFVGCQGCFVSWTHSTRDIMSDPLWWMSSFAGGATNESKLE